MLNQVMAQHVQIRPGDCASSIAFQHGLFVDTIWSHPENAALRQKRASAYVLQVGDDLFVPDPHPKDVPADTDKRHVFRRRGVPEVLRIRLLDPLDAPRAGVTYTLKIEGGAEIKGATDSDGWVIATIPPNAMRGTLELPDNERYSLNLGHLEPADTILGMQQRLRNLRYPIDKDSPGQLGPDTWSAVRKFLFEETGDLIDDEDPKRLPDVQDRLSRRHGS